MNSYPRNTNSTSDEPLLFLDMDWIWENEGGACELTYFGTFNSNQEYEDDDDSFHEEDDWGLLASSGPYDDEDKEADATWKRVDEAMESRRKHKKLKQNDNNNPPTGEQFSDLKQNLASVSETEWGNIPEAERGGSPCLNERQKRTIKSCDPGDEDLLISVASRKKLNYKNPHHRQ
ncbi:protein STABILIZED1-like isoform X2 [Mercurialis annua]|uniref:protein STABILIZED1-like isoform X2 n=1 Tax=Mercurialis annua TaxID=3986 RepID=UPI00215F7716|nr:protein STABILIZED1-like isoform X2 [Mercurialis annua]